MVSTSRLRVLEPVPQTGKARVRHYCHWEPLSITAFTLLPKTLFLRNPENFRKQALAGELLLFLCLVAVRW